MVFLLLGILHYLCRPKVNAIVQVTQEKQVCELVCQVKLAQLLVFQRSHTLQNVVVVLISSAKGEEKVTTFDHVNFDLTILSRQA